MTPSKSSYEDGLRDGKIEALASGLADLGRTMETGFSEMKGEVVALGAALREEFGPVCKEVRGNGDPKRGIVSRLAMAEERLVIHQWLIYTMIAALIVGAFKLFLF